MVLTSLSKHTGKYFQIIIAFVHSAFIIWQSIFVLKNMVLNKILSLSNIQQMSAIQQWELFIHTYIHIKNQSWQSTASVERFCQRWQCY